MRKINKNTTVITEKELGRIVENIVRQHLTEEQLNEGKYTRAVGKAAKYGVAILGGSAAMLGGILAHDPDARNTDQDEINQAVYDEFGSTQGKCANDSVDNIPSDNEKMIPMESVKLTEDQFRALIRESVCRILESKGYMINEISAWQGVKSGVKALGSWVGSRGKKGFKQSYHNNAANYEYQNRENAARTQAHKVDALDAEYKQLAAQNPDGKLTDDQRARYNNELAQYNRALETNWKRANRNMQYRLSMRDASTKQPLANAFNPYAPGEGSARLGYFENHAH